jgi:hypothetical protein
LNSIVLGKLLFAVNDQLENAPLHGWTRSVDAQGRRYNGHYVLLAPWRRNRYGERAAQKMLVVGWRVAPQKTAEESQANAQQR